MLGQLSSCRNRQQRNMTTDSGSAQAKDNERSFSGLLADLKRRRVFRVLTAYSVVAWLLLQIADVLSGAFPVPDWTVAAVTIALAMGFPIVAALSWAFQLTPGGLVLDVESAKPVSVNRSRLIHFIDVIIICFLLIVVAWLTLGEKFTRTAAADIRVAVLPFENLSDDEAVTYLSEGIADDIRARLYQVPQLLIAARSSSLSLFGKGFDVKTIGERLTVAHVLEGTIQRVDNRIRVTAQLVDVESGFNRWSKTYNTRYDDILELQNNISLVVASELEVLLSKSVRETLAKKSTDDPVAYDFYLQAQSYLNRPRTPDNLEHAAELFERAIVQDPDFALGYAGMCQTWIARYYSTNDVKYVSAAESQCQQALSLDPSLSQVHTALGKLYVSMSRWNSAENSFSKAIELDPRAFEAFTGMGDVFAAQERYVDAEARYLVSIELLPGNWAGYNRLAYFLFRRGRIDEAIANYQRVIELTPDNAAAYNSLGVCYYTIGDFAHAAENFRKSLEIEPLRSAYSNTGVMYYYAGNYREAAAMFEQAIDEAESDYRLWGNLADALRFIDGREQEAVNTYRKAIELALRKMAVSGNDAEELTNLAWYYANSGEQQLAERYVESAAMIASRTSEQLYVAALVHTVLGNADLAETAILNAKQAGFSEVILDATPELKTTPDQGL